MGDKAVEAIGRKVIQKRTGTGSQVAPQKPSRAQGADSRRAAGKDDSRFAVGKSAVASGQSDAPQNKPRLSLNTSGKPESLAAGNPVGTQMSDADSAFAHGNAMRAHADAMAAHAKWVAKQGENPGDFGNY